MPESNTEYKNSKAAPGACYNKPFSSASLDSQAAWLRSYFFKAAALTLLWFLSYFFIEPIAIWLLDDIFHLPVTSALGGAIEFFIYDTAKILLLLLALIYIIACFRASLDTERLRSYLKGKKRILAYFLASVFGSVTPFCSCSSIPLFLAFASAGIPFGITMAFLITSPLINEIAVVLLWGLLGWKFTILYVLVGLLAGILGGFFMDAIGAERWLQPFLLAAMRQKPLMPLQLMGKKKISFRDRHEFARRETLSMFKKVWKWVLLGVGIGAALHGFVPDDWFAQHFGAAEWWTVPAAVFIAIPLYSNVTGIVPIMESLLTKGMPIGTTMAFCMSAVAASIPEMMLLRQMMTFKLQAIFLAYLWLIFTLIGWLFNYSGNFLLQ